MSAGPEDVLPTDFGKYRLVKRIATGGMAEIFLAHRHDAPAEPIVIKRILPHLVKSGEFVSMFLDEARIAAQLRHENIVRIDDVGQVEGAYYIAMEYVHGEDIRRIYNSAYKLQRSLPLSHSIRAIAEAAQGLSYAHKLTDLAGRPMGVVHRDVSPQNILVTYEGGVKVVDFGIAKAANKVNQTRAGVLKGKYSYMSPEQALGDAIDHRTDMFALGIILYETTTGTRLFKRHNELATLQAIIKCEIVPPSEALPGYPSELEAILLKALAKHPDDRFGDAAEFSEALFDFLRSSGLFVEPAAIADFMRDLFKDRLDEERGTGEPALPAEDEMRQEMADLTSPMGESDLSSSRLFDPADPTGNADTRLRLRPSRTVAEGGRALLGFDDEGRVDPTRTALESDDEALARSLSPRFDSAREGDERHRAYDADLKTISPAPKPHSGNRNPTEIMRPTPDGAQGTPSRPRNEAQTTPPPDMMPTVAVVEAYAGPVKPALDPPRRGPEPERSSERSAPAEATEQVRARVAVPAVAPKKGLAVPRARRDRAVAEDRRRVPTRTQVETQLLPRLAIALGAIIAAVLAGIVASTILRNFARTGGVADVSGRFGRVSVLTEPGAVVIAGETVLGRATAEGIAGPFLLKAGEQTIRVVIEDLGFDRERTLEIEADRIHEFEIRARLGFLDVKVQPWARVLIDGREVGITPLPSLKLYEGRHRIALENADAGLRHETTVRVEAGQVAELKVNLNDVGERM